MQAAAIDVESVDIGDSQWALSNLRKDKNGRLLLDFANCLRIVELHPDFKGRYKFNDVLGKVLDRGTVMIEWRLIEFTATVQERFLPEVPYDIAVKALIVAANKATGSK